MRNVNQGELDVEGKLQLLVLQFVIKHGRPLNNSSHRHVSLQDYGITDRQWGTMSKTHNEATTNYMDNANYQRIVTVLYIQIIILQ